MGNENEIVKEEVKTAAKVQATGASKEILSIIETQQAGFLVSISRSIKVGRTAAEVSTVKMEGHAKDLKEAYEIIGAIDHATQTFITTEGQFYGIDPKTAALRPSPVENKKE